MIELLKAAFVQDGLTRDEMDARVDMALTADLCGAVAVTAGVSAD